MTVVLDGRRWGRLWALAILAHIVGNPRIGQLWPDTTALGVSTLLLGLGAIALLRLPDSRWVLGGVSLLVLVTVWFEAPIIGNHWLLAGFVSAAMLAALPRSDWWARFVPAARWMLLGFYSFAAFSKLNAGFFDSTVSCGLAYANQVLSSVGLTGIEARSAWAMTVIIGTVAIELAVPVLLLMPRTRRWGILLGLSFHYLISLDLGQHFFDFTAVLFALFLLFDPQSGPEIRQPLSNGNLRLIEAAIGIVFVLGSLGPASPLTVWILRHGAFWVWVPLGGWIVWRASRSIQGAPVSFRLATPVNAVLVALLIANGIAPYLELKTATAWNMYANLVTVSGESNHFIVRRTIPVSDVQSRLFEIVESDNPKLEPYVSSGWRLPARNVRMALAEHPGTFATVSDGAALETVTSESVEDAPDPVSARFRFYRAVDDAEPPRCQMLWLPAG